MDLFSRLRGGFYGLAVGDALGATLEFMPREEVRAVYGVHRELSGGGWLNLHPGEFTDDTEMTLAVAGGLLEDHTDPLPGIGRRFLSWYESRPRDIGNIVRSAIKNYLALGNWEEAARHTHEQMGGRSAGNGSLMRTLPLTFTYLEEQERLAEMAVTISGMTHYDPQAGICCALYNELLRQMVFSSPVESKDSILTNAVLFIRGKYKEKEALLPKGFWDRIKDAGSLQEYQVRATGYVLDSLEASLWSFLTTETFEEAVVKSVNLGDDADTVGAICGGLAGGYYGFEAVPPRWVRALRGKDRLEALLAKYFSCGDRN